MAELSPKNTPITPPPVEARALDLSSEGLLQTSRATRAIAMRISRSKIELFTSCKCCFYLDRKLEVREPPSYPLTLNIAVDDLLKKEFDLYREVQKPHPLFLKHGLDLVPFKHPKIDGWRDALHPELTYYAEELGFLVSGGLDDVWVDPHGVLYVADYKATAKKGDPSLDGPGGARYQRQIEVYQWLLRKQGFTVSDTAYFVYCNGDKQKPEFAGRLEFSTHLLAHDGTTDWIEPTLREMRALLDSPVPPAPADDCKLCEYFTRRQRAVS